MSTVLDVAVCLLFVGTAVVTLSFGAGSAVNPVDADRQAAVIATSTAAVPSAFGDRHAHDTFGGHLARAAIANATIDDRRVTPGSYPETVERSIDSSINQRVYITATWEPYPEASIEGHLRVGDRPPSDATVAATSMTVASGIDRPDDPSTFDTLAAEMANAIVDRIFPPERTRAALVDGRTADVTADRYRTAASALDTTVESELADGDTRTANDVLAAALSEQLRAELRAEYPSPEAAATDTTPQEVRIVVRRWEP